MGGSDDTLAVHGFCLSFFPDNAINPPKPRHLTRAAVATGLGLTISCGAAIAAESGEEIGEHINPIQPRIGKRALFVFVLTLFDFGKIVGTQRQKKIDANTLGGNA